MAAVPQIGRATRVERPVAPGVDAASDLYERYSPQILSYCLHQLGSREEAEDAVQTTFMNAFRGLQRGIVPELESAWLFKIAHNVCLSRRRSSWRRGRVEAPNNFEVLQEVVPGREQVADELIGLPDVLEEMPENQRRAILLREWQGLTYREISAELGLTQAAVETLIFRARRALAQGLEQDANTWKRRLRRGADVSGALACVKALLGGGGAAAVKVAATAIAVATTAVAAATELPREAQHAPAAKTPAQSAPAAQQTPTTASSSSSPSATLAHRAPVRTGHVASGTRTLPKPVAVPASDPQETAGASLADPTPPAPTPTPPAPEQGAAPAAPPAPAPSDGGKGKKGERQTQATTQPTETTPVVAPEDPPVESEHGEDREKDKGKPDDPGRGDANANANASDHGNGKGNGKGK